MAHPKEIKNKSSTFQVELFILNELLLKNYLCFAINSSALSTISTRPQKKGTLWCSEVGSISRILWKPFVAFAPACSAKKAIGLHS